MSASIEALVRRCIAVPRASVEQGCPPSSQDVVIARRVFGVVWQGDLRGVRFGLE
jgi:hypothetical protein